MKTKPLIPTILCLLSSSLLSSEKFTITRPLMGTTFTITTHAPDQQTAANAARQAFSTAAKLEKTASDYLPSSELSLLSSLKPNTPKKLSPELFTLLQTSRDLARKTQGRFDPTLGPLTKLWRESRHTKTLPKPETLAAAHTSTGWEKFTLNPKTQTITLTASGMSFDLGGIAKGHAADLMLAIMKENGLPRTSITAGGEVRLGDPPPNRSGWNVGLKTTSTQKPDRILTLKNCAISTSGDLHQFIEIQGQRHSHILNPKTGLGLQNQIATTIIAPNATLSDALATAASNTAPKDLPTLAKTFQVKILSSQP